MAQIVKLSEHRRPAAPPVIPAQSRGECPACGHPAPLAPTFFHGYGWANVCAHCRPNTGDAA